ncbi:receptor-like protein 4 [Magnolia sinica]|uniref:receptor-like protein 4 n=1 Tax=Magnolia sinica TaxID=86752 RepID=UPI0026596B29|nr:receptor-like protein 4 [Magnolia sinica]
MYSFTSNAGLCGIPGLPTCGPHLSTSSKVGITLGAFIALALIFIYSICWSKRQQNILRAQKLAARDAPYAKARTHFVHDVQMTRPYIQDQARVVIEIGPRLLSQLNCHLLLVPPMSISIPFIYNLSIEVLQVTFYGFCLCAELPPLMGK